MILVGYHATGAYKLYDQVNERIEINRDVVISEAESWSWKKKETHSNIRTLLEDWTENDNVEIVKQNVTDIEHAEAYNGDPEQSQRKNRKPPARLNKCSYS